MQSWNYVHGGKGFVSNERIPSSDTTIAKTENELIGWDLKTACSFGNNMVISSQQAIENQHFGVLCHQELVVPDNSIRVSMSREIDGQKMMNPFIANNTNAFSIEEGSNSSRLSSGSVMDCNNSTESSFIDLKLGRFVDPTTEEAQYSRISKGASNLSSSESSTPPKRMRVGLNSQTSHCQVYGCNKDLSSSKEYHKRHKVCEVHSKTAKVIVNGIEQRFCQQCSRFHLLAEFDDGKRSCRKRLAGHNERRRKPQAGLHPGRTGRLLQSYNGFGTSKFHGTTSFICQDILPSDPLLPEKFRTSNWGRQIKIEEGSEFSQLSTSHISSEHMHSKSLLSTNNLNKAFVTCNDNEASRATGNIFGTCSNQYPHDIGGSNSDSPSLIHEHSMGNDDFTTFDAVSSIQGLSGITNSGCALSLLSSQSNNFSSHSSGMSIGCQFLVPVPGNNNHYSVSKASEKVVGVCSQTSASGVPKNKFSSSGTSSAEGSHLSSMLLSDGSDVINFDISDGIYQGSNFMNAKDQLMCEDGTTINLLQLSSELQRVERQKQAMQVKQENDGLCWPHIT